MVMTLILTVFSANTALAQEENLAVAQQSYSQWAFDDLVVGDTYDIYPQRWYQINLQKPITNAQLRVLMAGVRRKLLNTDSIIDYETVRYNLSNNMTVEKVLGSLYTLVESYEFDGDVGIVDGGNATEYMAKYGVFTGNEGELSLKDICSVEQACVIATRLVTYLYDALDAASKGFLWEIKSEENTVYLLGSIHMANHDVYPFSNKMLKAFKEADVLGVEVNLMDTSVDVNNLYMQYGVYTDGTTLKDHVSEETYQKTVQFAANFGMTEDMVTLFKPWALYNSFAGLGTTSSGTIEEAQQAAALGIDMKFLVDAYLSGKPIVELESYELQIQMLDSFSDGLEEMLLVDTIDAVNLILQGAVTDSSDLINLILNYWHEGDVESFMNYIAPLLVASEVPDMNEEDKDILVLMEEYNNKLFTERDKGMAEKIDSFLKSEGSTTYFVVVGTGHYISEYSVLDILEELGYEINLVK
jgi:uncharacterized protein YbaP (TraB family)